MYWLLGVGGGLLLGGLAFWFMRMHDRDTIQRHEEDELRRLNEPEHRRKKEK